MPKPVAAASLAALLLAPPHALAEPAAAAWQVTPRIEYSDVVINGRDAQWRSTGVTVERATAPGDAVFATLERQDRDGTGDDSLQLGVYRRFGDWNAFAQAQVTADADFLPERTFEVQADRAVAPNLRAGLGYRRLDFSHGEIGIWSPQLALYRGDDEYALAYKIGRNDTLDHDIRIVQLRALKAVGRHRLGVYLARGDYLFDALGLPGGGGSGWSANLAYAHALNERATLRVELGRGSETDSFRQDSLAVSLQYRP